MERRTALPHWMVSIFGLPSFVLSRIAQEYAIRRELAKASEVGAGVSSRAGLFVFNRGKICIGRNVSFGTGVDIACYQGGSIDIGDDVFIGNNCIIAAAGGNIRIGADGLIAEGVSIRAGDHGMAPDRSMRVQPVDVRDISIGRDVWLAKGVAVIAGTTIADGCVIAANAVARGTTDPYGIYGGVPIRKIGDRRDKGPGLR